MDKLIGQQHYKNPHFLSFFFFLFLFFTVNTQNNLNVNFKDLTTFLQQTAKASTAIFILTNKEREISKMYALIYFSNSQISCKFCLRIFWHIVVLLWVISENLIQTWHFHNPNPVYISWILLYNSTEADLIQYTQDFCLHAGLQIWQISQNWLVQWFL